jgi:hypothetical protein
MRRQHLQTDQKVVRFFGDRRRRFVLEDDVHRFDRKV